MADPRRRVDFRQRPVGGGVRDPAITPPTALTRKSRVVLLIHGYNNDFGDAEKAYDGFIRLQQALNGNPSAPVAGDRLVEVYWPGDENWGVLGFLAYMRSIPKAIDVAGRLANALIAASQTTGLLTVDIVAHSMGCRLAVELIDRLRSSDSVAVGRVSLMAAAVPTFKLAASPKGALRDAMDAMQPDSALALYSRDDSVLRFAFPPGQTAAGGDEGTFPTALGHDRWSDPTQPPSLRSEGNPGAGHSDYWGWKDGTIQYARVASRATRQFLRFSESAVAGVAGRVAPDRLLASRDAAAGREIPTRALPGRSPGPWETSGGA